MKTIVLLSGGLDSATVLAACVAQGDDCLALGFDYGQPHSVELRAASYLAKFYKTPFKILPLPTMPKVNEVVFAGRNLVFISTAIAYAQAHGYRRVAVGCNASDWAQFPDCRPQFWRDVSRCAEVYGVLVLTPLIHATKRDVVKLAREIGVPIDQTWSCYSPKNGAACGECLACTTRQKAMEDTMEPTRAVTGGLEERFIVERADGKPIDPARRYSLVLDFSGADPHALVAAKAYADSIRSTNPEMAAGIEVAIADPANAPKQHRSA